MATTRQLKIARQIQKDMAEIIQQQGMQAYGGALVTVMGVEVSPDLGFARVYVSVFPSDKGTTVMSLINVKQMRAELGNRVKHQLRIVPELAFALDTSLDYVDNIERLLRDNHSQPDTEE